MTPRSPGALPRLPLLLLSWLFALVLLSGCHNKPAAAPERENADSAETASPAAPASPTPAQSAPASSTPGPATPTPASPVAAPLSDGRPVIAAFGDSLTAGHGADAGQSYPDYLQKELDARGYHDRVVNEGISGNTSKDGVDRLQDVLRLKPVLVIVEFGGNDGLRGLPISTTRENLDQIVRTLTRAGIKVVMGGITLPPNYGADYIREFNQTYALIAARYHAPLLPFILQDVYGVPGSMQQDGIHATAQGNQQVARNLLPLLLPLLGAQNGKGPGKGGPGKGGPGHVDAGKDRH